MHPELIALYGGPDQVMGLASGMAAFLGILLMFWNKVLVILGRIANKLRPDKPSAQSTSDEGSSRAV